MKIHRILALVCGAAALLLSGCTPSQSPSNSYSAETVSMVVTEENISQLDRYQNLREADLTGSTCYDAIGVWQAAHPDVTVHYTVSLGPQEVSADTQELHLHPGEYAPDVLVENLSYLKALETLTFTDPELTRQELEAAAQACPKAAVSWDVSLGADTYPHNTQTLDLSGLTPEAVAETANQLSLLDDLSYVELMQDGVSLLSPSHVAQLQSAAPEATFHYTFSLFGQTVSTTDERIEFQNQPIGDEGEAELRQALEILKDCRYFLLDDCGFSNPLLAELREEYRDTTKLVWRIYFGSKGSCLTDREVIRYVYGLEDYNSSDLYYCEDARYVDLGHNVTLSDCSFVAGMKNLECIILSGSSVSDITAFQNCKKLEFLELSYCTHLTDISCLSACDGLNKLNISFTSVRDLSALDALDMELLCAMQIPADAAAQEHFISLHPGCLTQFRGKQPYGYGWRYVDYGYTYTEYYANMRKVFDYDNATNTYR